MVPANLFVAALGGSRSPHGQFLLLWRDRVCGHILSYLAERFPNYEISELWLRQLIHRLRACNLMSKITHSVASTRKNRNLLATVSAALMSPLAIRIPLFNPAGLLRKLRPLAWFCYHPFVVAAVILASPVLVLLVLSQLTRLGDAPLLDPRMLLGDRWLGILLCYVVVKSLHELGHALACIRFNVDCREIGLYVLFFTPCFYCDTTESWRLRSKWQRIAISAAGMYVELLLAGVAAVVWLLTRDSILHSLAANTMLVCTVGTLAVNANPLLKYDGYYILSDLWGVPNLSEQSREAVWELFMGTLSARPYDFSHLDANVFSLAGYAIASFFYRLMVFFTILWIAWVTLVPLGLGFVTVLIMSGYALATLVTWARILKSVVIELRLKQGFRIFRIVAFFAILYLTVKFVVEYPIDSYITARAVTDYAEKVALFAPLTGEIRRLPDPTKPVVKGEVVFQLHAPDKELALSQVHGELALAKVRVNQLQLGANIGEAAVYELPAAEERVADLTKKEQLLLSERASLTHRALRDGKFMHTTERTIDVIVEPTDDRPGYRLLDPVNAGCTLQRGDLVGWIIPEPKYVLTALVSQEDVKRLSLGKQAACYWDSYLNTRVEGTIIRISPEPTLAIPPELVGDPLLITSQSQSGQYAPELPHYEVTLAVSPDLNPPLKGSLASIRAKADSQTIVEIVTKFIRSKFRSNPQS
jgi:putative peptide zinc metalloprotease protein